MAELRSLKRRAGVAEEALRIKKERLDEARQEYEEEHSAHHVHRLLEAARGEVGAAIRRAGSTRS